MFARSNTDGRNSSLEQPQTATTPWAARPGPLRAQEQKPARTAMQAFFSSIPPPSIIKVRVQNANLGDLRDRQLVASRRMANRLRRGPVVDAEGPLAVRRDVGVEPSDAILGIVVDDLTANSRADFILRNGEAIGKISFDQITGHRAVLRSEPAIPAG